MGRFYGSLRRPLDFVLLFESSGFSQKRLNLPSVRNIRVFALFLGLHSPNGSKHEGYRVRNSISSSVRTVMLTLRDVFQGALFLRFSTCVIARFWKPNTSHLLACLCVLCWVFLF